MAPPEVLQRLNSHRIHSIVKITVTVTAAFDIHIISLSDRSASVRASYCSGRLA